MSSKQTYFQADWLLNDEFKIWLASVPEDNTKACCKLCKKSFGLSNMGKAEIIWAPKTVYSGYSYNSSKDMSSLFHTVS